ncbi:MAG: hypothetical protein KDE09_07780 [Anaerolineales bacterium]|nr:hypothetical protein [Anaerolineales bacterium]MCB0017674.1 hypothetical protein [Anaerolineales bacterium]MCB0027919.1 hypothetical protein [Anaerolineales bacterium]MCB8960758.1 hypothetical protein [Ardenticatenales bacterium]
MNTLLTILLQPGVENPDIFANYLTLGYVLMWGTAFVYIISLWSRQRNTKQDLQLLRRLLEEDEADRSG